MAAASTNYIYQAPVTCGICEKSENVDYYCLECKGNFCVVCKVDHAQTPMYKNHKMIPIFEGLKHHAAVEKCNIHLSLFSMHCNDCHKLVCDECIATDHNGHVFDKIADAIQKVQREINEYHVTLKTKYLSKCISEEAKIKQNIAECKNVTLSLKSNINAKREELINEVNGVCDNMISKAEDEEKNNILDMEKAIQELQDTAKEIDLLMTKSKEVLTKMASEQIKFDQEKPRLTNLTIPKTPKLHLPSFVPGKVNIVQIGEQIGTLLGRQDLGSSVATEHQIDVSITHRQSFGNGIQSVNVVDTCHAWVSGYYKEKELRLVTIDGNVTKCINTKFDIFNFAVTTSGDIIATDYHGRCIRIMTQTGQVTQTINTSPNYPSGVCLGNNNKDFVVCVNTPNKSNSKLMLYSRVWKDTRTSTINYTDKPVGELVGQRVTQNNMGDYCVAHWGHNKVYVMDNDGAVRYIYDGIIRGNFEPFDICSDIYNHLFISDYRNHNIHMLDNEGRFLRFLFIEQDGITKPTGLCFDEDGRLWVGQDTGGLCVVKYFK